MKNKELYNVDFLIKAERFTVHTLTLMNLTLCIMAN